MPQNPKFAYEANEPAFLQRLRGQYGGDTSGRLERPAARPKKLKDPKEEEDDEPVYLDEESNEVITKEEYKALVEPPKDETSTEDASTAEGNKKPAEPIAKQSNLTEVGGQRKRKQVKVVGEEENKPDEASTVQEKPKKTKKAKKIKLSFDEE
ncbi:hypothetical protein N7490_000823 [Penicillium lividum]|nr:hypothetical protein N7490_000823 [Penicillium lividum]